MTVLNSYIREKMNVKPYLPKDQEEELLKYYGIEAFVSLLYIPHGYRVVRRRVTVLVDYKLSIYSPHWISKVDDPYTPVYGDVKQQNILTPFAPVNLLPRDVKIVDVYLVEQVDTNSSVDDGMNVAQYNQQSDATNGSSTRSLKRASETSIETLESAYFDL